MAEKRFYWLKLGDSFFQDRLVKKMKRMPGGHELIVIFQRLIILSMQTGGELRFEGIEDDLYRELALDMDERPEAVQAVLGILLTTGRAKMKSETCMEMADYSVLTGSESSAAERQRKHRATLQGAKESVTLSQGCNAAVTEGNAAVTVSHETVTLEKELELELELELDSESDIRAEKGQGLLCASAQKSPEKPTQNPAKEEWQPLPNEQAASRAAAISNSLRGVASVQQDASVKHSNRFKPPTIDEVRAYCKERENEVDPERFWAFYQANGWKAGKNSMKDWRAAIQYWERNAGGNKPAEPKDTREPWLLEGGDNVYAQPIEGNKWLIGDIRYEGDITRCRIDEQGHFRNQWGGYSV